MSEVNLAKRAQALFGSVLLTLAMVAGSFAWLPVKALAFAGGDGTSGNPWQISDCTQLQSLNDDASYADDSFILTGPSTIDCSGIANFNTIDFGDGLDFLGNFDGNGRTIANVTIENDANNVALFMGSNGGATFHNLTLEDFSITNDGSRTATLVANSSLTDFTDITVVDSGVFDDGENMHFGGLVGMSTDSSYVGISVEVAVMGSYSDGQSENFGGVVGSSYNDTLHNITVNSYSVEALAQILAHSSVGGVIGYTDGSRVSSSTIDATVGGNSGLGGAVGVIEKEDTSGGYIGQVVVNGSVEGSQGNIGGLVGRVDAGVDPGEDEYTILDSEANGTVVGSYNVGGFIGRNEAAFIINSYATGDVETTNCECGFVGGFVGYMGADDGLDAMILQSFSTSDVNNNDGAVWSAGGFVGEIAAGEITDAYARGDVHYYDGGGGFAGYVSGTAMIGRTYATGAVLPADTNSGYTGSNSGLVANSFWDIDTSGQAGSAAGTGLTTEEATTITPYQTAGFDFTDVPVWSIGDTNDGYPCLTFRQSCSGDEGSGEGEFQDLNGDSINDAEQPNIGGYISSHTGKWVAIDVGEGCELTVDDLTRESSFDVQDATYEYDNGLWEFEAECAEGATTTIKLYYYDVDPSGLVLRKHNDITGAYFTVTGATIQSELINASHVTVVTYQITDNGDLDLEKEDPGMIRDPAGLARNLVGAPNTGLHLK